MAEYNPSKIIKDGNTYNFRDTTKIPLSGSNAISGSLIPATDNSIDIGSSTKNIKMLYTKGITIDGTQFLPSDYIPRSGGAVLTGTIFSRNDTTSNLVFRSGPGYADGASIQLKGKGQADGSGGRVYITAHNGTNITTLTIWPTGEVIFNGALGLKPSVGNSCDLGTSTNKWKSLNGINPGALSLPSTTSGINLDLTDFKLDGSDNKFRLTNFSNYPYDNGWLFVRLNGCTYYYLDHWYKVVSNGYTNPITAIFFMPITDIDHDITLRCVCTSIDYIRVFPCQGNV